MRTTLVALLSICVSATLIGQTTTAPIATTAPATTTAKMREPGEPPDAPPTFDKHDGSPASISYVHGYDPTDWKRAGLDDRLSVHVNNFSTLVAKANNDCAQIVLFLDGLAIKGLKPESCDRLVGHIRYRLLRTNDSDIAWHALLGSPHGFTHTVTAAGPEPCRRSGRGTSPRSPRTPTTATASAPRWRC